MTAISIVGAGPGGLTCARILQRHGVPVTVYDADPGPGARNQGGSLDLHDDNGQVALREAGLLEQFFALARAEAQEARGFDPAGRLLEHHVPAPGERTKPEIDRGQLRELLLGSLAPGTVRWGHALTSTDGRALHFTNGATVETDLVIGADGAFSRVRPALSPAVPRHTGVSFLEAWFDDVENAHPELAELVGPGSAHAADGDRGLFAQRNSGGHLRVYVMRQVPADWLARAGLSIEDTPAVRAHVLAEFASWGPSLRRLLTDNDGPFVDRPIWALPVPHTWPGHPSITLLGDAAHLMPPLGVGVNLAMLDASDLALAIAGAPTLAEAVRTYEATMLPRSTEIAKLLEDGPQQLLEPRS